MSIIVLQMFVGLVLVAGALLLLGWRLRDRDHEHHDRLSLMPLESDERPVQRAEITPPTQKMQPPA